MKLFLRRVGTLVQQFGTLIREKLPGGLFSRPDPAKPFTVEWHLAESGEHGRRLFVFLPGRRDRASDFARHGFIVLAQGRVRSLDCVAVDATIGYYFNGSIADRLQREI